jgi:hypothetical protein
MPTLSEPDESNTGPASLVLIDPDGNPILIDLYVDRPPNLKNTTVGKRRPGCLP